MTRTPDDTNTPVTYSREEARLIREALHQESKAMVCPRCGGNLALGQPAAAGGTVPPVWEVRCEQCRRSLFVSDLPATRRPKEG
jgi:predicted  nucleic acid-binding Zn ribbon protein